MYYICVCVWFSPTDKSRLYININFKKKRVVVHMFCSGLWNLLMRISQLEQFFQGHATLIWRKQPVAGAPPTPAPWVWRVPMDHGTSRQDRQLNRHGVFTEILGHLWPYQNGWPQPRLLGFGHGGLMEFLPNTTNIVFWTNLAFNFFIFVWYL